MSTDGAFYTDPTFWVAGSFVVFVGGLMYLKVHKQIAKTLDERSEGIKAQLDEASALRDEAEKLLCEYQKKQRDAQAEADAILAQAKEDAKLMKAQAKADISEMIERRTRVAGEKIIQLEAIAVKEVQNAAVTVAIDAATKVLQAGMQGDKGVAMVNEAIAEVETKLN